MNEAARQPYDNLSPEDQAKIDNVDQLEADKVRLEKLMEVPFAFSLSGNALNMVNTGIETGYRGYVYKVEVPEGTETIQIERYKDIWVLNKNYEKLIPYGQITVKIATAGHFGKDNIFRVNFDMYYDNHTLQVFLKVQLIFFCPKAHISRFILVFLLFSPLPYIWVCTVMTASPTDLKKPDNLNGYQIIHFIFKNITIIQSVT